MASRPNWGCIWISDESLRCEPLDSIGVYIRRARARPGPCPGCARGRAEGYQRGIP
jgi:hypothetical protein